MEKPIRLGDLLRQPRLHESSEERDLERIARSLVFDRDGITRSQDLPTQTDVSVGILTTRESVMADIARARESIRLEPARELLFRFRLHEYRQPEQTNYFLSSLRLIGVGGVGSVASSVAEYRPGEGECHTHHQFLPDHWDALSPGDVQEMLNTPPWVEPNGLIRRDKRVSGVITVRSTQSIRLQLYQVDIARALELLDNRDHDEFLAPSEFISTLGQPVSLSQ